MKPFVSPPPYVQVGRAYRTWAKIGASKWLVRQLRYGLQLPWTRRIPYAYPREYPMHPDQTEFAKSEVKRWVTSGFAREATDVEERELRRAGTVFPAFVTETSSKARLVVDYKRANECMQTRTFRMSQVSDLAATLTRNDALFKCDIKDAYYHLRLRHRDQHRLAFVVCGKVYIPLCLNCGLAVAPWFFTKAMYPVVGFLRKLGHRVFSYLDDFFGSSRAGPENTPANPGDIRELEQLIRGLFRKLGLSLHPTKCDFRGNRRLEILGILVDTEEQKFLVPPSKVQKLKRSARALLRYAASHCRYLRPAMSVSLQV